MPSQFNVRKQTLGTGGGTVTISLTDHYNRYYFDGSGALAGNWSITTSGTPVLGTLILIDYTCQFTLGANTFTILGQALTAEQALTYNKIECYYNGSAWEVKIFPDFTQSAFITNSKISNSTITGSKIASNTVTNTNRSTTGNHELTVVEVSFEAGEQSTNLIRMPDNFSIDGFYVQVIKALAATDAGTVVPEIAGVPITLTAAMSFPASTAINTGTIIGTLGANTGSAGAFVGFPATKVTAGGKLRITMLWYRV